MTNKFLQRLYNDFAKKEFIDKTELKRILLSGQEVRLYGEKLDGTDFTRDFIKTIDGPSGLAMGGARYWEMGLLILWSNSDTDFRTIVLRKVKKIRIKETNKLLYVK